MRNKITLNELFSGIGAQRKALLNIGYDVDVVGISEIDKYAIKSYEAIFGKTRNYGDISKVNKLDYADLWTYSFPCTDISVAGRQEGINHSTRSGLLYQVQRLLDVAKEENTLPKYLLLENVKNLVGKKFKPQFDEWLKYLEQLGYKNYWQVLNAKDYGIPQNRERVFVVSIKNDIDFEYVFPQKEELKIRLKDVLEKKVDNKFYLSEEQVEKIKNSNFGMEKAHLQNKSIASTICATNYKRPNCIEVNPVRLGGIFDKPNQKHQAGSIWDRDAISPTIDTMQGGYRQPLIIDKPICLNSKGGRAGIPNLQPSIQDRVYSTKGISTAITCSFNPKIYSDSKIRKITPKECWRLMGFNDEDFEKAQLSGVSNSQLYKQAGNSIVVNVLEKIFKGLKWH